MLRSTRSRPSTQSSAGRPPRRPVAEAVVPPAPEPASAPLPAPEPIVVTQPELVFAARADVAEPPRPLPAVRRGIFFDVENSSRPEHVAYVLDHLALDWTDRRTEFVAVGNWRVVSVETARLLARRGAQLVHSAPSTGVRDWSDLRIAVAAGAWLASARPGDSIEVVSDDQAFEAIGDVAASLGIAYRRLSFRALAGRGGVAAPERSPAVPRARGRGRRGRRRHGVSLPAKPVAAHHTAPAAAHAPATAQTFNAASDPDLERHPAPAEEIRKTVEELLASSPHGVTLDALSNALKAHGFRRPPGSLRLITRLRHLKGIEVTRSGLVRLVGAHFASAAPPEPSPEETVLAERPEEAAPPQAPGSGSRRRRRRGGGTRRRSPYSTERAIIS
jgi:hypothetical protein